MSNFLLLVLNLPLVRVWVQLLRVPRPLLFSAVLAFATLGVYSLDRSLFDVGVIYVLGLLACVLRSHRVPLAPIVLGVVLGPLLEQEFRRAMAISGGDPSVFVTRPVAAGLLVVAVLAAVAPGLAGAVRRRRTRGASGVTMRVSRTARPASGERGAAAIRRTRVAAHPYGLGGAAGAGVRGAGSRPRPGPSRGGRT